MPNALTMPGAELPPEQKMPQPSPAAAPGDELSHIEAGYDKIRESQQTLNRVKNGLDHLVSLGDTVTVDDVVQTAGKLIGGGITAEGMASLLAEMPDTNPEQLMMWIGQRDQDVNARIEQAKQMAQALRHQMGAAAVRKIMANGQVEGAQAQAPEAGPAGMTSNVANSMGL